EGMTIFVDENTNSFYRDHDFSFSSNDNNDGILEDGLTGHYLKILNNDIKCLDCTDDEFKVNVDLNNDNSEIKLDENGLRIKTDSNSVEINKDGIKSQNESVKVKIGKNGIEINSDN